MTGISHTVATIDKSSIAMVNGLLSGLAWEGPITYSFPTLASDYTYTTEASNSFAAVTAAMQTAVLFAIETDNGNSADDGFSVEGFTNATFDLGDTTTSTLRFAQSSVPKTAYAYFPTAADQGGDMWFGTQYDYTNSQPGNYAWHTVLHEIGHALGLKHPHEKYGTNGLMSGAYDKVEYSVMSYRAFQGASLTAGYTYAASSAPQTYMMADIAALQHMYGADYSANAGDTVYSWSPQSGDTYVNGARAIDAIGSVIFATIWDGGGTDTYDLSDYTSNLTLNLDAGKTSNFGSGQVATLGGGKFAAGNIYNALMYLGNTASLIENATGGSGNDTINGNILNNELIGGGGNDKLYGLAGDDGLYGGDGSNYMDGNVGNDTIYGGADADTIIGGAGDDSLYGGDGTNLITDVSGNDIVYGGAGIDTIKVTLGDDIVYGYDGADLIYGGAGSDTIYGGGGADKIWADVGNNVVYGDAGTDSIYGGVGLDTIYGGDDGDLISTTGGNDMIYGDAGNDSIYGGIGNDTIYGGDGDDLISGDAGNNLLYGDAGADTIKGNIGIDTIYGGGDGDYILASSGNDILYGDAGNDTISGGLGNDNITGGDGADVFVFESLTAIGKDVINDFDLLTDYLKFGVSTMSAFLDTAKQVGDNTVITFSAAASITLVNFDVANVHDILIAA